MRPVRRSGPNVACAAWLLASASVGFADEAPLVIGVQTHFSQGWDIRHIEKLDQLGVRSLRDSLPWADVETAPGVYVLPPQLRQLMTRLETSGKTAILTFAHNHPAYEDGQTPFSDDAIAAKARYVAEIVRRYGPLIRAVEVGNEINGHAFTGPAADARAQTHVRHLRAVSDAVRQVDPDMPVWGGAVHSVPLGFLAEVFEAGGLEAMDGLVFHPYRSHPEHLEAELSALKQLMAAHGAPVDLYVTEFGHEFEDIADAPGYLLKMLAILSDAEVKAAYWYALLDQAHFRNMGLYDRRGQALPAARALEFASALLRTHGDLKRQEGDGLLRSYRSADGQMHVLWGAGHAVSVAAGTEVFSPSGDMIAAPTVLGDDPVVLVGAAPVLGPSAVLADSLLQFGLSPWRYEIGLPDGRLDPLSRIDWDWTSYLGYKWAKPAGATPDQVVLSGPPEALNAIVETAAVPAASNVQIDGLWQVVGEGGDGVVLRIHADGDLVHETHIAVGDRPEPVSFVVPAASEVSFEWHPGATSTGDRIERRITLRVVD
jgi:hypothetical protein